MPSPSSLAVQYVKSKSWKFQDAGDDRIVLENCPFCGVGGSPFQHFYLIADSSNKDGLWICHKCGKSGNLRSLMTDQGDTPVGTHNGSYSGNSVISEGGKSKKQEALPDVDACHEALLEDEDAMDYLMNARGFSHEIIVKQKLGLDKRYFRECGDTRAILFPYLVTGNPIFVHWRTLPTMPLETNKVPKAFSSPTGWEVPLYNGEIIRDGLKELILCEGEANTIACLDKGIENIVGVPGANIRKAMWLTALDAAAPDRIYICYDKDRVGQKAAQELAARIGLERCWKIKLPDFTVTTDQGEVRTGKDLNEWFVSGGGDLEKWDKLKQDAILFDVDGVCNSLDALDQLEESFEGLDGMQSKYSTPWNKLNALVGFDDGDVIDILASEKIGKSVMALNLLEHMANFYKEDGIFICLEMPVMKVTRKWICYCSATADFIPKTPEEGVQLLDDLKRAAVITRNRVAGREGSVLFCYPQIKDIEDMYTLIRDVIRRYGVKWVVVDNLQLLADKTLKNMAHRTMHLSQISKTLAGITKDANIKMIRILQPHRIKDGQITNSDSVDGSSQIAKDCDCMISLHRNKMGKMSAADFSAIGAIETHSAFEPEMLVTVGLSRYSCGGQTKLYFDGATSTVSEFEPGSQPQRNVAPARESDIGI
jgi:hypothetical protein